MRVRCFLCAGHLVRGTKRTRVLYAARAVGSLFSAGTMSLFGPVRRGGRWILIGVGIYGVATVLFADPVFWFSVLMLAVSGAGDTTSAILRSTINQLSTPDELRGECPPSTPSSPAVVRSWSV